MDFDIQEDLFDDLGEGVHYDDFSQDEISKFKGVLMLNKDKVDVLHLLWKQHGLRGYKKGLFWMVNPIKFSEICAQLPEVSDSAYIIARSGCAGLFVLDKKQDGIFYVNLHTSKIELVSTSIQVFMCFDIIDNDFWKEDCYGKVELKALKEYGTLNFDECFTFVPALAFGGNENVKEMKKVKIEPQLDLLVQMLS